MSVVSPSELALLRERPHSTKLWLSIYKPSTVLSARVNDIDIAVGEYQITYDGASGSFADIESGMTMLVGTAAGKADKGRIRVRSATATVITVAENSHINWADDDYLTIIAFYEIWPIYARYILEDGEVTWYKDYDIAYTNQNGAGLGTIVNMGSHYAGFTGSVYYSAVGSINVAGDGMTYAWEFEGGTPSTSSGEIPGNVNYPTPGHYTTKLTITSTTSVQDVAYRHISIYNRPEQGTNVPILRWEMDTLAGNRDEGGHSVAIRIHEDVDDIVDGSLVVIFADDIYGSTVQSIGGNAAGRQKIFFVGYIRDGSIQYDYQRSQVEFEVVSPTEIMKAKGGRGTNVSTDSVTDPVAAAAAVDPPDSPWNFIENTNVRKALYHYFRWHSTVLLCCDLSYNYTNYEFQYFDTDPSSIYDGINTFLQRSLIGRLSSDRQGALYAEVDPAGINDAVNTLAEGIELTRQDWINEPDILEIQSPPLAYLEMGGVAWSGATTGTFDTFLSAAPGDAAAYFGGTEDHQGLILTSQDHLNTIAGDVFAWKNAKYPSCTFEISGNYRNFDIAPMERTLITLNTEDTHRGIVWAFKSFIIHDMEWAYDPQKQLLLPTIELHEVTAGYAGTTVIIPETPMENFPDQPPFVPPPFDLIPPPGPIGFPPPPPVIPQPPPPENIPPGSYNPDCLTDINAPANGPYDLHVNATLESNRPEGDNTWGSFFAWIRSPSHVNKTELHVTACWEQSADGGTTWTAWTDMSSVHAYATGWGGQHIEQGSWGAASEQCEMRVATFVSRELAFGYEIVLDEARSFPSGTYYSYGGTGATVDSTNAPGSSHVDNPGIPLTTAGNCSAEGTSAHIHSTDGSANTWVIYDLGRLWTNVTSFKSRDLHDGDQWIEYSTDKASWPDINYARTSWSVASCSTKSYSPANISFRYIRYRVDNIVLIGDHTNLAWFQWNGEAPGTIYRIRISQATISNVCFDEV